MSDTIEKEILTQEDRLLEAKRTLDSNEFKQLYADDLIMTGVLGDPTCSKSAINDEIERGVAQRASACASGKTFEASVNNEDMKITALGDTAVANYRFIVKFKGEGINVHRKYRTTNVWARRAGGWQIVAAHTAFIIDPKQAAILSGEATAT